ncbi:hypothetical protein ACFLVG_02630 [Chloroflexota bacterium]
MNNGSGNFTDSGQLLGSSKSYCPALGDLNGDGSLDAFVANYMGQANKVWLNEPATAVVEISVILQGDTGRPDPGWVIPLNAKFYTPNTTDLIHSSNQTTVKSDSTATANFTGIAPGTYDIYVFSEHTMTNYYQDKVITAPYTFVDMGTLKDGDANSSGFVNFADFLVLLASFGLSDGEPGYDPMADFNRGGFVNFADFLILLDNFGNSGPFDVTTP